ncbi:MAG: nicotinate (nicotinamide) nucleotide adenylyltransferase [Nitrospinae bacterium CG11_big_fil_rev_8_21_14_0_20_56_8]|nr:MAG: nicotinate (nicotinamide) nucleotide adenylyltransferase [Nitrospinae bacterium CG11_big_fil_rev_8_21_14_0_20_56_8]
MQKPAQPRVGLLGGTFDPVHHGHLNLAREVLQEFGLDRIIFIPVSQSPHKQNSVPTSGVHRVRMLELAIRNESRFEISRMEIERGGISYTIDTVERIQATLPGAELYLILGMDAFRTLGTWKEGRRLFSLCHLILGARPGNPSAQSETTIKTWLRDMEIHYKEQERAGRVVWFGSATDEKRIACFQQNLVDISSTQIRENFQSGGRPKNQLPPDVERYIIQHHLYQARPQPLSG